MMMNQIGSIVAHNRTLWSTVFEELKGDASDGSSLCRVITVKWIIDATAQSSVRDRNDWFNAVYIDDIF